MPSLELNFLPDTNAPSDEELCLQLVYGICGALKNPKEEHSTTFVSSFDVPLPHVRRLAKMLVAKLNLPIPQERVDEWIDWHRHNQCWIVNDKMSETAKRLAETVNQKTLLPYMSLYGQPLRTAGELKEYLKNIDNNILLESPAQYDSDYDHPIVVNICDPEEGEDPTESIYGHRRLKIQAYEKYQNDPELGDCWKDVVFTNKETQ